MAQRTQSAQGLANKDHIGREGSSSSFMDLGFEGGQLGGLLLPEPSPNQGSEQKVYSAGGEYELWFCH